MSPTYTRSVVLKEAVESVPFTSVFNAILCRADERDLLLRRDTERPHKFFLESEISESAFEINP